MAIFNSLFVYTVCLLISYLLVKRQYNASISRNTHLDKIRVSRSNSTRKMPIYLIIIISLIFTFYCHFSMAPEDMMAGDRQNYLGNFAGSRESPSIGLTAVIALINLNGGDFHTLLYFCTFISMVLTLLAYRYSKDATPECLLLLFLSQCVLTTLTALKQCYTSAFSAFAIVLMLQDRSKLKELFIYALIFLAIYSTQQDMSLFLFIYL